MTALCGKTVFFALLAPLLLAPAIATPLATPARAEDTNPGNADNGMVLQADPAARAAERERLFATLAAARNEAEAKSAADQIWLFWFRPPDAQSGKLMSEAMERRRAYDLSGAVEILDRLVA